MLPKAVESLEEWVHALAAFDTAPLSRSRQQRILEWLAVMQEEAQAVYADEAVPILERDLIQ